MSERLQRRGFLRAAGATAAVLAAARYSPSARGMAANETIQVGCIGTGGRCRRLMQALGAIPGTRITAVCDVWDAHLEEGRKLAAPGAFATKDYQALLARSDVDAVLIGAPDHWHVPLTIAACAAGKDVYVEKPLTHELDEGAAVIRAQAESRRIVQVGMQQRSMPQFLAARQLVADGVLGKVHKVHLTWNRNAPPGPRTAPAIAPSTVDWARFLGPAREQPFDAYRFRNWRWFWDFGGGIFTDLMVHHIDIVHWFLDLDHPDSAASIGDFFAARDTWETPETVQTLLRYPGREVQVYFEGTFSNARNGEMLEFMGTQATLYLDRGRFELHSEPGRNVEYQELILGEGPRGADFYSQPDGEVLHLANWLECVRSRQTPLAPAEAGVSAAAAAHLANRALRSGEVARWR